MRTIGQDIYDLVGLGLIWYAFGGQAVLIYLATLFIIVNVWAHFALRY